MSIRTSVLSTSSTKRIIQIGMAMNNQQFFLESIDHMETLQEPFCSFLVALTSHTPYEIDKEDQTLDLSGYEYPMLKRYYQTVHYVDTGVRKMIDELKQRDLWEQVPRHFLWQSR